MELFCNNVLKSIIEAVDGKKGGNVVILDVRSISEITDYFVFVEGRVSVHVKALVRSVIDSLKQQQITPLCVEGLSHGDWVVVDYGFVIVHVFVASVREHYRLEELWRDGAIISLD